MSKSIVCYSSKVLARKGPCRVTIRYLLFYSPKFHSQNYLRFLPQCLPQFQVPLLFLPLVFLLLLALLFMIFEHLDIVSSTCASITFKDLHAIHRRNYGLVPLKSILPVSFIPISGPAMHGIVYLKFMLEDWMAEEGYKFDEDRDIYRPIAILSSVRRFWEVIPYPEICLEELLGFGNEDEDEGDEYDAL